MSDKREELERFGTVLTRIVEDYTEWRSPFSDHGGITMPVTNRLDTNRDKALFLTLTTALNRQRDAEHLYAKFEELWYDKHWIFEPEESVANERYEDLVTLFEQEGIRFGEKDAQVWFEISRTLYNDYDANPMNLFAAFEFDMQRIEKHVKNASGQTRFFVHGKKFPALRGDKIRPMWLRLINNQVHPLGQMGGSDVSVDTHLIQITNKILDTDYTASEASKVQIRRFWREVCQSHPVQPIEIDGPLWYLDRGWDDWGKSYFERQLSEEGLELDDLQ